MIEITVKWTARMDVKQRSLLLEELAGISLINEIEIKEKEVTLRFRDDTKRRDIVKNAADSMVERALAWDVPA